MPWWTKFIVPMLIIGLAGVADARSVKGKRHHHRRKGPQATILKVSGGNVTVSLHARGHHRLGAATFHTTAGTAITVNGVGGKSVGSLHKGQRAAVSSVGGTARTIVATDGRTVRVVRHTHARHVHHKKKKK